jgi:hypothetical protein
MRRDRQPPFSPDLAPSDFYLFGKLKTTLMGSVFGNEQKLLDVIMRVFDRITRDELESVFEEWVARFDICIHRGGDSIEREESTQHSLAFFSLSDILMLNNNETPCMSWPFGRLFLWTKPYMLMICRKVESRLIMGDDELTFVMFDKRELAQ